MIDWLPLLGAFGLGSVIATLVQSWMSSRAKKQERSYQERKEAYVGLLESWVRQEIEEFSTDSILDVGHWVLRAELVASPEVFSLLRRWMDSEPGASERIKITNALKSAMRRDLL